MSKQTISEGYLQSANSKRDVGADTESFNFSIPNIEEIKQSIAQNSTSNVQNDWCISSENKTQSFIIGMSIFIGIIFVLVSMGVFLLIKQRNKYPIRERSFLLSIQMCICFFCLSIYYPMIYILVDNGYYTGQQDGIFLFLKWLYMWGLYGLYISYFSRSIRIYAAYTDTFTDYFNNYSSSSTGNTISFSDNNPSPPWFMKRLVYIFQNEWVLAVIVAILSLILCLPLFWDSNFYLIPIQNYDIITTPVFAHLGIQGDFSTIIVYQITVSFFIVQIYTLRKIPKHYRFHQETKWNLCTQWLKSFILFVINISYFDISKWCDQTSNINIILGYVQFVSMIGLSVIPALVRSRYVPATPPDLQLDNFIEFIEDEGDNNNLFCNTSFITYLSQQDKQIQRSQIVIAEQTIPFRYNLNIYDFFFEFKTSELQEGKQKLIEIVKIANCYIFNPKEEKYELKFPTDFQNGLYEIKDKYNIFNEFHSDKSLERPYLKGDTEEMQKIQLEFIEDMETLYNDCIKYLKERCFKEYTQTKAFRHLDLHYKQQNQYQINLKLLKLLHKID